MCWCDDVCVVGWAHVHVAVAVTAHEHAVDVMVAVAVVVTADVMNVLDVHADVMCVLHVLMY